MSTDSINIKIKRGAAESTLSISSVSTVGELRDSVGKQLSLDPTSFKLLHRGKMIKPEDEHLLLSSASFAIGAGSTILVMGGSPFVATSTSPTASPAGTSAPSPARREELRQVEIDRLSAAATKLAARDAYAGDGYDEYTPELFNQDGSRVTLPAADEAALTEGLLLDARGRVFAQRFTRLLAARRAAAFHVPSTEPMAGAEGDDDDPDEVSAMALGLLLKAAASFANVHPRYIEHIDNVPRLHLEIVWLYLLRGESSRFPDAAVYLADARRGFDKAYGKNLERLKQLSGGGLMERILCLRLRLLEGVIAVIDHDFSKARLSLMTARAECDALRVSSKTLAQFCAIYPSISEDHALRALRATNSGEDIISSVHCKCIEQHRKRSIAASHAGGHEEALSRWYTNAYDHIMMAEAKEYERIQRERHNRHNDRRQRRWGRTAGNHLVSVPHVDQLVAFGFEEALAVEALRQTNNDVEQALQCLLNNRELLEEVVVSRQPLVHRQLAPEPPPASGPVAPISTSEAAQHPATSEEVTPDDRGHLGAEDVSADDAHASSVDDDDLDSPESDNDEAMHGRLDEEKLATALMDANDESSLVDDALDLEHELIDEWIAKAEAAW